MRDRLTTALEIVGLSVIVGSVATWNHAVAGGLAGLFMVAVGALEARK